MNIFEEEDRKIYTMGITLTKSQMENYRIKRVFNTVGNPDYLNIEQAEKNLNKHISNGELCLLEIASTDSLFIISLITFEDIWSRNVFAIKNMNYNYQGFPDLMTIYN
jgi:hypothetical protein